MNLTWQKLKAFIDSRNASYHYEESDSFYEIEAFDGPLVRTCSLKKDASDTTDVTDFETNYKPYANSTLNDVNGIPRIKTSVARLGSAYLSDNAVIVTGLSVTNNKWDGTSGDFTAKFYNASDVEVSSGSLLCTKTVIDYRPSSDYEIIGGKLNMIAPATLPCTLWVIGGCIDLAATVPSAVSEFIRNLDLRYILSRQETDGRASKFLSYSTEGVPYPTNSLRFIIKHSVGYQFGFMVTVEKFR